MPRLQTDGRLSIHGRRLGVAEAGNLMSNGKAVTSPCVDATVAVSATATSPRAITVTLKDADGNALDYACNVELVVYSTTGMVAFTTTGGSTGLAIGANGALLAVVAKKVFKAISDTSGVITLTHTDSGTDACYLGVVLPNGQVIGADRVHTIGT
jgi:hypothetical protein